jgi:hypothetical protein
MPTSARTTFRAEIGLRSQDEQARSERRVDPLLKRLDRVAWQLIILRPRCAIDHQHFHGTAACIEFQTELLRKYRENGHERIGAEGFGMPGGGGGGGISARKSNSAS